ncbi:hypothetical protein [Leptospira bandrabouensis]|uniref:Uncharacterized protein n=1 Tax=Leptospira bandrabouensis TaxID=2484903 RepID=A0A6H3NS53_9LEPT|nr:hypothetical protein [Leptospira bandrabouensis]MCG6154129.1 hypothetical protein [Leptospira bandrabouensis]TGN03904.1 hypothetical protein EHR07_18975 [Leptospira bandrabouensis]TGN13226.1 hypothetical protein EHR08_11805 [Leptospira bandrabouensis]
MKTKILIITLSSLTIYSLLFCAVEYYFDRKISLLHRIDEMTFASMTADYIENKLLDLHHTSTDGSDNKFVLKIIFSLKNKKLTKLSELKSKDLYRSVKLISDEHKALFFETGKSIDNLDEKYGILNQFIVTESTNFSKESNIHIKYISLKSVIHNDSILVLKKNRNLIEGIVIYQEQASFRNLSNYNELFFIINSNDHIIYENGFSKSKNFARKTAQNIIKEIKDLGFIQIQREVDGFLFQICPIKKFGFYYVEVKALDNLDVEMHKFKMIFSFLFFISFFASEAILLFVLTRKQPSV